MKIIVTGASGFIGSSYLQSNTDNQMEGVCLIKNSLSDLSFKGADVVLHLAALVHQMKGAPYSEYYRVNTDLAYETALKAKKEGIKQFVFMSTIKVYGESTTGKTPYDENSECFPADPYGKSKLEAEKMILQLEDKSFKVAIIRSPLVYGVGVKANMFNLIKLIDRIPFLPFGRINNKRSFVYVGNLTSLIDKIIFSRGSGIFIARDPENISTTELTNVISKALNKSRLNLPIPYLLKKIILLMFPLQYDRLWGSLEVDPHSGWNRIGFSPPVSTENGITDMVKWYNTVKNLKGSDYE